MRAVWTLRSVVKTNEAKRFLPSRSVLTDLKEDPLPMFELILPHLPPRLQEAILSPDYTEICVNEDGRVFVESAGSNAMLELAGIAINMRQRLAIHATYERHLREEYSSRVFATMLPSLAAFKEAGAAT